MAAETSESNPLYDQSIPPWKKELLLRKKLVSKGRNVWSFQLNSKYGAEDFHQSMRNMRLLQEPGDYIVNSNVVVSESKIKMVEERVTKRHSSRTMDKLRADYLNSIKSIDLNGKDDVDGNSDSSEELQYGPGIVNKLKSKYLSMTLRDNQRYSSRPSLANLRRATSLENMLDDDAARAQPKAHFIKKQCNTNWQRNSKISQHHAKYLGISKGESMKRARSMDTLFKNEPKSVRPNGMTQSVIANEDLVIVDRDSEFAVGNNCAQDDKELPPPDVVKQTKKIFEKTTDSNITSDKRNKKTVLNKVTNNVKVGAVFEKPVDRVKPQLGPKPVISGDKLPPRGPNWPNKRIYPVVTSSKTSPNSSPVKAVPPRAIATVARTEPVQVPQHSGPRVVGLDAKPVLLSGGSSGLRLPSISVKPNQSADSSPLLSPVRCSPVSISSPVSIKSDDDPPDSPSRDRGSPIAKFYAENSLSSCFPRRNLMQATNPCLIKNQTVEPTLVKQVAVIRPIPAKKPLTEQEVENNLINTAKSVKKSVDEVGTESGSDSEQVQSWKEKSWQNANTMVFNFSSRPTVPDYIENDGLNITGRAAPKQNEKRDEVDTEEEWEATPFCDVSFVGDNVLINGKSSLRKDPNPNKVRARRIKFNDEATTLYEYPSEDSLIDEPSFSETRSPPPSPTPSPLPNTPIGGATLSRYTPSKSPAPTGFELGVTSTVSVLSHTQHSTPQPLQSDEYLKPVNMDQEMAWSQETTSDILF
uniref:Uncharacterized protein n=1 Tax=Lygus hesperus TaxID=30085 RepID=A0A146L7R3_LYGHE